MGRPSRFDEAIFAELLERMAAGETLRGVCRSDPKFPAASTVRLWVVKDDPPGVAERYSRARESCIHEWIDEITEICDDRSRDTIIKTGKNGEEYEAENTEWINRARLRVDTRKWIACKVVPKLYGERTQTEVSGPGGGPVTVSWVNGVAPAK